MAELKKLLKAIHMDDVKDTVCSLCIYGDDEGFAHGCPANTRTNERLCDEPDYNDIVHYFPKITDILSGL